MDLMMTVLRYIPDVNHPVNYDKKLLDAAVENRNVRMVATLLELGADFRKTDLREVSYLHVAVCSTEPALIEIFLKVGLDINSRDRLGRTPLHYAALGTSLRCLETILENKPELNPTDNHNNTPMNLGIKKNEHFSEAMLAMMLKYKCDASIPDAHGNTPLHNLIFGSGFKSIEKVQMLVGRVNINEVNNAGKTPLHLSLESDNENIWRFLIENGADIQIEDKTELTAFHLAHIYNFREIVRFMIKHLTVLRNVRDTKFHSDIREIIESDDGFSSYFVSCVKEIWKLNYKLGNSDLVASECYFPTRKIIGYARNDEVKYAIHKFQSWEFPLYGREIRSNLKDGLYRRHLEDVAEEYYSEIFDPVLPSHCVTNMIRFFTKKELVSLSANIMNGFHRKKNLKQAEMYFYVGVTVWIIFSLEVLRRSCLKT